VLFYRHVTPLRRTPPRFKPVRFLTGRYPGVAVPDATAWSVRRRPREKNSSPRGTGRVTWRWMSIEKTEGASLTPVCPLGKVKALVTDRGLFFV
jgi:hypothetical protein